MPIGPSLRRFLLDEPAVAAIVGDRVYPVILRQHSALPALTYFRVSADRPASTTGPTTAVRPRIQIDAWAGGTDREGGGHDAAVALADLVRRRLDGFRGAWLEVDVLGIEFSAERDLYDEAPVIYRVSQDFMIWYSER